jgi:hypothetical protein
VCVGGVIFLNIQKTIDCQKSEGESGQVVPCAHDFGYTCGERLAATFSYGFFFVGCYRRSYFSFCLLLFLSFV